ncbi:GIY-YIG nuclease family protein [Sphingomonas sabuli]|uniref:GIY-YIG nuclease family protein n=1 Tax=Sphingomonas sabuli TaxID=2764186 RepID=A0A7G9L4N2_9SPHN|nr:GIY-YIG nuclease family protein [Sphingomonas sabuli]QNM83581.1 GIY-YIG nuclease family protein [Sphingomonas sabuli]
MQFWVYILKCRDGSYYTGHTDDLDHRIGQHIVGQASDWTRRRLPVELVWCEAVSSRLEALEAERRIKPWSRAKKEGLIARDWARVSHFARPPHERPSTSLGTNGAVAAAPPTSFVSTEVETRSPSRGTEGQTP